MKPYSYLSALAAFLLGFSLAWALASPGGARAAQPAGLTDTSAIPVATSTSQPGAQQTGQHTYISSPSPVPSPVPTGTPAPVLGAGGVQLGWHGQQQCYQCTPMAARVKLSSYNPTVYNPEYPQLNCWNFSEEHNYCLSPVWIGAPWESGWGLWAACPAEWPIGTWVDVPGVGAFICMDHGGEIVCKDGVCRVDILGPGGAGWDGAIVDVTLWVPKSYLIRLAERNKQ